MRVLKAGPSRCVAQARGGQVIDVTLHDKPLVRIVGIPAMEPAGITRLMANGAAQWGAGKPKLQSAVNLGSGGKALGDMALEDRDRSSSATRRRSSSFAWPRTAQTPWQSKRQRATPSLCAASPGSKSWPRWLGVGVSSRKTLPRSRGLASVSWPMGRRGSRLTSRSSGSGGPATAQMRSHRAPTTACNSPQRTSCTRNCRVKSGLHASTTG